MQKQNLLRLSILTVVLCLALPIMARGAATMIYYQSDVIRDTLIDTMFQARSSASTPAPVPAMPSGSMLTGDATQKISLTFKLYYTPLGGDAQWTEFWSEIPVYEGGLYSALLGSKEALYTELWEGNGGVMYLEILAPEQSTGFRKPIVIPDIVENPYLPVNDPIKYVKSVVTEALQQTRSGRMSEERAAVIAELARTLMQAHEQSEMRERIERLERTTGITRKGK